MAKPKSIYICSACGAKYSRWQGICSECGEAATISETLVDNAPNPGARVAARALNGFAGATGSGICSLSSVDLTSRPRISTGFSEFDRVLGGGIVSGSVTLIGGNPGAGKSTLLLQTVGRLCLSHKIRQIFLFLCIFIGKSTSFSSFFALSLADLTLLFSKKGVLLYQ